MKNYDKNPLKSLCVVKCPATETYKLKSDLSPK